MKHRAHHTGKHVGTGRTQITENLQKKRNPRLRPAGTSINQQKIKVMEKKWYQSKIFLLAVVMALVGATDLAFGWLSGAGVTPEQIQIIDATLPGTAEGVKDAVAGKNYFGIITAVGGFITAIWRAWFTSGAKVSF